MLSMRKAKLRASGFLPVLAAVTMLLITACGTGAPIPPTVTLETDAIYTQALQTADAQVVYRFNSQFNLTHTVKRMWEMGEDKFDIGVVCHHHELSIEPFYKHGQQIWAARPGSYQVDSAYNRRMGFNKCKPSCPTFILFPDAHEILGFPDIRQAANILTILRKEWPRIWPRE